ncbi:hypothetical protein SFRURICE_015012 [Spodoptera frugiperda]|nr:hypothetical protein SFRURICE_015012 [Spodoptera frugiperda]
MNMKVPKLYDAYKILVPKNKLKTFLNDDFWPEGVAYRRFVNFRARNIPNVLSPDTTVTDFFLPRGALDTCTSLGTSSFFFDFSMPLPPLF